MSGPTAVEARRPGSARQLSRPALVAFSLLTLAAGLGTACDTPPQVVEIAPARSADQVASDSPVRIRFDRPVDQHSVATRFTTTPSVRGSVRWNGPSELVFEHESFAAGTTYRVALAAGYRDTAGHVNGLVHGWSFHTEPAPRVEGSNPAAGATGIDPAGFLSIRFTREMDLTSLRSTISISPASRLSLRQDPSDAANVLLAPVDILAPDTGYLLTVPATAVDAHGNPLASGVTLPFRTGAARPLHHQVTFLSQLDDGQGAGVWTVDQNLLPRRVVPEGVTAFSWSPDGLNMLVRTSSGTWDDVSLAGERKSLPFTAERAAYLHAGYAYLAGTVLSVHPTSGADVVVTGGATDFAVSPDGLRLAFATTSGEVRGYAVELGTQYRLQAESGFVSGLAFSADGSRLAYRLRGYGSASPEVRIRDLERGAAAHTVATGVSGDPRWLPDSGHLLVPATVPGPDGTEISRAFRVAATAAGSRPLDAGAAIPMSAPLDVQDPWPSPDGHQVAFRAASGDRSELWLMNADGTGLTRLTRYDALDFPYSCVAPAWTRA